MAGPSPIAIAAVSGVLLLAVLAVDANMNRTYTLDVLKDGTWETVAEAGEGSSPVNERYFGGGAFVFAENDTVSMRVRVDNGYPWSAKTPWEATVQGRIIARGELDAGGRATDEAEFSFPATTSEPGLATPAKGEVRYLYVNVMLGDQFLSTNLQVVHSG